MDLALSPNLRTTTATHSSKLSLEEKAMNQPNDPQNQTDNHDASEGTELDDAVVEKLNDAMTPGFEAEFDPDEAERAGAFAEDALSEADALESTIDTENED